MGHLEVNLAHESMVGCGVVFCEVVGEVFVSWSPVDQELALLDAVLYPIESHVHGFGFALSDSAVGDASGGRVIGLNGRCRLWVMHLVERRAGGGGIAGIVEESGKFDLCCRGHDVFEDAADCVDGTIGCWLGCWWLVGMLGFVAEEEASSDAASGFGLGLVRGVAVDVENHVAGDVADGGIWVGDAVVEELMDCFCCCFGPFGLCCSDSTKGN